LAVSSVDGAFCRRLLLRCVLLNAVLQALWRVMPDESCSSPMPYAGRLSQLLMGDPYLQLSCGQLGVPIRMDGRGKDSCGSSSNDGSSSGGSSSSSGVSATVKLRVQAIEKLLNF
jgi:hypothetical protein